MSSLTTSSYSTIVSEIYKCRNTVVSQLQTRGYDVSSYEGFSIHELSLMNNNNQLDILVENENKHKVYVKYNLTKLLRESNIYEAVEELFNMESILSKETDHLMFIIKTKPNDTHRRIIQNLWDTERIFISIIDIASLQYNILEHNLVPNHRILNDEEVQKVKETYNIDGDSQFPEISRFDPVATIIGLRPGQIVEIKRPSKTAIFSNYYRICY
jgi:DNA-directed RNA polymerase subunit H (RpoH/RPB5)